MNDTTRREATAPPRALASIRRRLLAAQETPVLAAAVVVFAVAAIAVPQSLSTASLRTMLVSAGILAVAAIGQTLVVQQKGIDLSVAGYITLSATIVTILPAVHGVPLTLAIPLALMATAVAGALNGFVVTKLQVTPIIATLAMNSLLFGVIWTISGGNAQGAPELLISLGAAIVFGLPLIVWICLVLVVSTGIFMAGSVVGNRFVGVGASPASARAAGARDNRFIVSAYLASGLSSGIAGLLLVSYLGKGSVALGTPYLFPVISAVVVGGAILSGGRGSVVATAIAALFLSQVVQMMLSLGAPQAIRLLVDAIAIAVAAALRIVPWRKLFQRWTKRSQEPVGAPSPA